MACDGAGIIGGRVCGEKKRGRNGTEEKKKNERKKYKRRRNKENEEKVEVREQAELQRRDGTRARR